MKKKDSFALEMFGKPFEALDKEERKEVKEEIEKVESEEVKRQVREYNRKMYGGCI